MNSGVRAVLSGAAGEVKRYLRRLSPEWLEQRRRIAAEPILPIVATLVDPNRMAIDVGAHVGLYTRVFARLARQVVAFEPLPHLATSLRRHDDRVQVFSVALGNESHARTLFVPYAATRSIDSRASLNENANQGLEQRTTDVEVRRLDDYRFDDVGIIKIDVEGHEHEVLLGAEETIRRCRPALVVEIEERHHPGRSWEIIDYVRCLGYRAYFVREGKLNGAEGFDFDLMQRVESLKPAFGPPTGEYINNFVFLPIEHNRNSATGQ